jgi:hypothetical protein
MAVEAGVTPEESGAAVTEAPEEEGRATKGE